MRDQELVLRFLALYFNAVNYRKPMKEFLNNYMGKNRHLNLQSEGDISKAFASTIEMVRKSLGSNAFRPKKQLNAAVFDSVMVGIAKRVARGAIKNRDKLKKQYQMLLANDDFMNACVTGTANEDFVSRRLTLATDAFATLE
jgi:hypothetical protein